MTAARGHCLRWLRGDPYLDGDELVVPYQWVTSHATGTMRCTERGDRLTRLVITFD